MIANINTHIAFRCPECGEAIYGFVGKFALKANLIRLKCTCGKSALDISLTNDGRVRLSVPCIFCKQNHNFVVSDGIFFGRDKFLLNCPYANMDICFLGSKENVDDELSHSADELKALLASFEAENISDIQPTDMDEDEILPDATVYDTVRFIMKELEADGKIDCPCHSGEYDLRFTKDGIEEEYIVYVGYCPTCDIYTMMIQDYLEMVERGVPLCTVYKYDESIPECPSHPNTLQMQESSHWNAPSTLYVFHHLYA